MWFDVSLWYQGCGGGGVYVCVEMCLISIVAPLEPKHMYAHCIVAWLVLVCVGLLW